MKNKKDLGKACLICGSTVAAALEPTACEYDGKLRAIVFSCCEIPKGSVLVFASESLFLTKNDLIIKLETARMALAVVAEKANISSEKLLKLLNETEIQIRELNVK